MREKGPAWLDGHVWLGAGPLPLGEMPGQRPSEEPHRLREARVCPLVSEDISDLLRVRRNISPEHFHFTISALFPDPSVSTFGGAAHAYMQACTWVHTHIRITHTCAHARTRARTLQQGPGHSWREACC